MLGWHRLRNYTAGSSAVHAPTARTHTRTVTAGKHNPHTHTHTESARLARKHSNQMAANTRHLSARYTSGLHLFRKNRLVPVCFAFMMAVCTGTVSYLAVNRQANAASAPSSPTNVSLSAGNASITVSWHSPISLGGGSLTNYIIEHRALGAGSWTTNNAAPTATSYTISGLTNDHKYQVRIAAKTASGTSPYAPILLAIPHAAPTISHVNPAADVTPGQTIAIQGSGFLPKGKTIVQVAGSEETSLALASDGTVYAWGENQYGQLGNGTNTDSNIPVAVKTTGTPMEGKQIVQIAAGRWSSFALASDGTVYSWGFNDGGQLGNGTANHSNVPVAVKTTGTPMEGKTIVQVASSVFHSLALASDGTVYAWGSNGDGPLGNGTNTNSNVPVAVKTTGTPMDGKTITQVAAGGTHSLALASDGTMYAWGDGSKGQLGNGTNTNSSIPVVVDASDPSIAGKTVTQISSGMYSSFALASDGTMYIWGENNSNSPVAVPTTGTPMDGKRIVQVIHNLAHLLALADDGTMYAWGENSSGQLGNGTNTNSNVPVAVKTTGTPLDDKTIIQVIAGASYSLALASDGTIYSWGGNGKGQLGNGTAINSTIPVAVSLTGNSALAPSTPKVTIGGVPATDVTIVDSNTITVKVPAHANGLVDVTVDLGNGDPLYKAVKTNAFRYGPAPATPGSGGAGSANGGNGQHYRRSRPGGTLANTGDNLTILLFTAGVLIAGALTLIIGVRLRRDWQA